MLGCIIFRSLQYSTVPCYHCFPSCRNCNTWCGKPELVQCRRHIPFSEGCYASVTTDSEGDLGGSIPFVTLHRMACTKGLLAAAGMSQKVLNRTYAHVQLLRLVTRGHMHDTQYCGHGMCPKGSLLCFCVVSRI